MTLAEWMTKHGVKDRAMAERLGVDRSTVSRVRRAKQIPSSNLIAAIAEASGGAVQPNSFFQPPYVEAA